MDASGNVFVSDTANARVRKISGGTIATVAGSGTTGAVAKRLGRRWIGIEREILALVDLGRAVLEGAEPQFRPLQIHQDADGPAILGFDRADGRHQLAHPLMVGVAHIDAENVGAGLEQPIDDGAIRGGRPQRRNDLGTPLPSHGVLLMES